MVNNRFLIFIFFTVLFSSVQIYAMNNYDRRPEFRIPTDPLVSLQYGMGDLTLKDFDYTFGDPGMIELKLGFAKLERKRRTPQVVDFMHRYLTIANLSTDFGAGTGGAELGSSIWRVGVVSENGYGYPLSSSSSIILLHSRGMTWSNVNIDRPEIIPPDEFRPDRFEDAIRSGSLTEAGVMLQLGSMFSVSAGFERSMVFERHLFWKWLGSALIEGAAHGLLDRFIDAIFDSSPAAGPVVNFLLKNGLSYAVYELRRSDMNWPFDTATPLHHDTFKVGMSFIF